MRVRKGLKKRFLDFSGEKVAVTSSYREGGTSSEFLPK